MEQATLIYNPESGPGQSKKLRIPSLLRTLRELDIDACPAPTVSPGHATILAREALRQDAALVIGWGGDGTLNEIAAGMLGSPTPLGILPGGTVNVFARATGIPRGSLEEACRVLREGRRTRVPVGMAGDRPFLLMAGIGIDGEVVHRIDPAFKKRFGKSAFWLLGFRLLPSYPFSSIVVRADGQEIHGTGLVAGKVRIYGPGYIVTPDARLEEPLLDVVVFQGGRGRDYLRYLVGVAGGFHLRFKDVVRLKAASVDVEGDGQHLQLDGEPAGRVPVHLRILPDALTVILPDVST
jgi:YegS/Rv2252/BmrU family lipid kinase